MSVAWVWNTASRAWCLLVSEIEMDEDEVEPSEHWCLMTVAEFRSRFGEDVYHAFLEEAWDKFELVFFFGGGGRFAPHVLNCLAGPRFRKRGPARSARF